MSYLSSDVGAALDDLDAVMDLGKAAKELGAMDDAVDAAREIGKAADGLDMLDDTARAAKNLDNAADGVDGALDGARTLENINGETKYTNRSGEVSKDLEIDYKIVDEDGNVVDNLHKGSEGIEGGLGGKFKLSEMTDDEIATIVKEYKKKAPIEIPDNASYKAKSMADGYEQITYKWNDGIYKYETRWHTRTSGAPVEQGNTWVVQRTKPGSGGVKPSTEFMSGDDWIPAYKWYAAIAARKAGTVTIEQIEILDKGHWKE